MKINGWKEGDTCDCCGRQGLVRVLEVISNDGELLQLGSDCARRFLGMVDAKAVKGAVKAEYARLTALKVAYNAAVDATPEMKESAELTVYHQKAGTPFSQRPARIAELRTAAHAAVEASMPASDLTDLLRFRQNPNAYAA